MARPATAPALILPVDGVLLRTELTAELRWAALGRDPLNVLRLLPLGLPPEALAKIALPDPELLPVDSEVLAWARTEQAAGREIRLASAAPQPVVAALAAQLGFSDRVLAGTEGAARLDEARAQIETGTRTGRFPALWRAIRPQQWVKNLLLFLPLVAAHAFALGPLTGVLLGILAFSAAASSIYLVNDLLDLEADRLHPTKRHRPMAKGALPLRWGARGAALLGLGALGLGAALGPGFLAVIAVYMALSLGYSLALKRMRWVDVFTLATLYTLRVVAGAAAAGVDASIFMLIFVFPMFLTLGCVKRLTELAKASTEARLPGRGYARADREDLLNMAGLGTVGAVVIFGLYAASDQASRLYPTVWILWLTLPLIALWLLRMVALGYRGLMDYDPIVFALRDRRGIGLLLITLSLMFYAAGLWAEWIG